MRKFYFLLSHIFGANIPSSVGLIHKCVSFNKGVGMEGSEMGAIYFKWPAVRHMGEKKPKLLFFSFIDFGPRHE